jgi:hypothetical protein
VAYAIGEAHYFLGAGLTSVRCKDECGQWQVFRYMKVCFGAAVGGSITGGIVTGMEGKSCRSETYKGYFYETTGAYGFVSGGIDIGYTDTGGSIPLPNGGSGVNDLGLGLGAQASATWCYYFPLQ